MSHKKQGRLKAEKQKAKAEKQKSRKAKAEKQKSEAEKRKSEAETTVITLMTGNKVDRRLLVVRDVLMSPAPAVRHLRRRVSSRMQAGRLR